MTVLSLDKTEEAPGITSFKITQDDLLGSLINDSSSVLAFRGTEEISIIVTEEQIVILKKSGEVHVSHLHSVNAAISNDFLVTVDDQRRLSVYTLTKVLANQVTAARQF